MREEIANFVFPVLTYGLRLRDQLLGGDAPDIRTAQKELMGLLQNPPRSTLIGEMGGGAVATSTRLQRGDARYPLVCWLDEIFIIDSPWKEAWTESKLEQILYGSNDRAWKFWEEAARAQSYPTTDIAEIYYLCMMLGFRGENFDKPPALHEFRDQVDTQLAQNQDQEWPGRPVELRPRTHVPPLSGQARKQRMLLTGTVLVLLIIPFATFLLIRFLNK